MGLLARSFAFGLQVVTSLLLSVFIRGLRVRVLPWPVFIRGFERLQPQQPLARARSHRHRAVLHDADRP